MKQAMITYLRNLGEYKAEPERPRFGICFNMSLEFPEVNDVTTIICDAAESWPDNCGVYVYPVSGEAKYDWSRDSVEGRKRRDLCLHVAQWIEDYYHEE